MSDLKKRIKDLAMSNDIDLVGFADRERFTGLRDEVNPFTVFPEGKTVIMIGERITRGSLRGVEEGSNFTDYSFYGYRSLDDVFTAQSCYDITCLIEDFGFEAVPIFPNPIESGGMGRSVKEGKPAPNVTPDFKYAAVACGLGEIGLNGEVLTPRFGTRQRFQMIVTDAVLASDPLFEGHLCDKCGKCALACPLGAIDLNDTILKDVCGKTMTVAKVDYSKCSLCRNGAVVNRLYKSAPADRVAALCNRTCLVHLEESDLLENKFSNDFRTREAWTVDVFGNRGSLKGGKS